jgi:hypothetical protein
MSTQDDWPPIEFCLPNLDELERISRGERETQRMLFDEEPDDSRAARLARILANVQGVSTANTMEVK